MRSISVHRAFAKVRGLRRRLRDFDGWADSFSGWLPEPEPGQTFWHEKIPVLDRLVDPPTARFKVQRHAIRALLRAATHLADAEHSDRPYRRIAVLLTLPDLFQSEVTVFFDQAYYQGFYYRQNLLPDDQKPSRRFGLELPPGFVELGNQVEWEDQTADGERVHISEQWWTIGQAL